MKSLTADTTEIYNEISHSFVVHWMWFFFKWGTIFVPTVTPKMKQEHTHTQLSTNQACIKRTLYRTCCVATKFNINLSLECYNKERERERHANRARFQWNRACFRLAFLHFDHVLNQSNPKQIQTNSNESYDYEIENVWHFRTNSRPIAHCRAFCLPIGLVQKCSDFKNYCNYRMIYHVRFRKLK